MTTGYLITTINTFFFSIPLRMYISYTFPHLPIHQYLAYFISLSYKGFGISISTAEYITLLIQLKYFPFSLRRQKKKKKKKKGQFPKIIFIINNNNKYLSFIY